MHKEARDRFQTMLEQTAAPAFRGRERVWVADVGSYDVNGNFRGVVADWGARHGIATHFTGYDVRPGPNVDQVVPATLEGGDVFGSEAWDIVVCSSVLEHVQVPWRLWHCLWAAVRPEGFVWLYTHHTWPYHPEPEDYWRFFPSGLLTLTQRPPGEVVECAKDSRDSWLLARKPPRK
jgi:hypothetical protein